MKLLKRCWNLKKMKFGQHPQSFVDLRAIGIQWRLCKFKRNHLLHNDTLHSSLLLLVLMDLVFFSFVLCGVEKVWRNWKKQFVHLYAYYYVGSIKIVQNFVWKHQSHCRVKNGLHDVCDNKCFLHVIKCVH